METTRYTKEVELYRTMWTTPDFSRFIGLSLAGEEGDHEPVEPGFCLEGKYQRIPLRGKENQTRLELTMLSKWHSWASLLLKVTSVKR